MQCIMTLNHVLLKLKLEIILNSKTKYKGNSNNQTFKKSFEVCYIYNLKVVIAYNGSKISGIPGMMLMMVVKL